MAPEWRLPQLNSVCIPDGIDDAAVRNTLLNDYNLEIGAGLGALAGKTWRIGLMGFASKASNVILCITALGTVLNQQGFDCNTNAALKAVADRYV